MTRFHSQNQSQSTDFEVDFSFSQRLHHLRTNLDHARFILENTIETVASLRAHADQVAQICALKTSMITSFHCELESIASELRHQFLTACKLLRLSDDIRLMVDTIAFYNVQLNNLV